MNKDPTTLLCKEQLVRSSIPTSLGRVATAYIVKAIQAPDGMVHMAPDYDWRSATKAYDVDFPASYTNRLCTFYNDYLGICIDTEIWNCHRFVSQITGLQNILEHDNILNAKPHPSHARAESLLSHAAYAFMHEGTLQHSAIAISEEYTLALAGVNRSLQIMDLQTAQDLWGKEVILLSEA